MKNELFAALFSVFLICGTCAAQDDHAGFSTQEPARRGTGDRLVTPVNQIVEPAGRQIDLPGLRPQAIALSPDGKILVTSGKNHTLIVIDPVSAKILQRVDFPSLANTNETAVSTHILDPDDDAELSYTGLIFSPDGSRIYMSSVTGSVKVFAVARSQVAPLYSIPLPPANVGNRKAEIPSGLALSKDGKRLYVVLNMSNRLAELDAMSGKVLRSWDVGVAPYGVLVAGKKIYVSNWGGRRPDADSVTGPAGHGTRVRVDSVHYVASEGSVSIIDSEDGKVAGELVVGKHASAMALSPNGRYVVVANAASDTLSVIDSRKDELVETIYTRQSPGDLFGASPDGLVFDHSGKRLFVCNGTQNAVAVIEFKPGNSRLQGLVPVGWYPGAITRDPARGRLYVANIKGMGHGRARKSNGKPEFNSHQYYGSVTLLPEPGPKELPALTQRALADIRYPLLKQAALPPRAGQPPRPVPERVGEPSVFKHVVYIIKENRTYDQILGDAGEGDSDPDLCVFGRKVTPNQHRFVHDFVLLDNTYCSSLLSADGHQWATTAFATDYMEKSFAGFPRSYPDGMEDADVDALAYSPQGFIWDDCVAHGKSLRDYGEFATTRKKWAQPGHGKREPGFLDHYHEFINGTHSISVHADPSVESLRPYLDTNYLGWDLAIPDVQRAAEFIKELRRFERRGTYPNFVIVCLPNDHTSGTGPGSPTPPAQVADNDLAFGQMVDALSHSSFWPETCIFGIEDDPQAGWDHVSGYRTTAYVISPYTKRHAVVSTQYNHTSLLRTMELMLGLPPMNQMDATATPMFDCFTNRADLTPYSVLTNNVALDQMNPSPRGISDAALRNDAYASARLPLKEPDRCPEDLLNRILWRAVRGSHDPYPAWAVSGRDDD